jgi:hypothetical protein
VRTSHGSSGCTTGIWRVGLAPWRFRARWITSRRAPLDATIALRRLRFPVASTVMRRTQFATGRRLSTAALLAGAGALRGQCPDGTPPPCVPRRSAPPSPVLTPQLRQLTTSGNVLLASVSEDGRMVAYADGAALYVRNLAVGSLPVEVSRQARRFQYGIEWFPDNTRLLAHGDSGVWILPSLGGARQLVSPFGYQYASLSPPMPGSFGTSIPRPLAPHRRQNDVTPRMTKQASAAPRAACALQDRGAPAQSYLLRQQLR